MEKTTRKNGSTLLMTVNEGAQAQIHCAQLVWYRKKSIVMRKTYPEVDESVGRPVAKYHSTQYRTPEMMALGISEMMDAEQKATHP